MGKKRTFEDLHERALKFKTRTSFAEGDSAAYQCSYKHPDSELIFAHMTPPKTVAYTLEELKEEALKHKRRIDFAKANPSMYNAALKRNDVNDIVAHMGVSLRRSPTEKEIYDEAKKYKTRGEFKEKSPNFYKLATKRPDLDQICSHMDYIKIYWTNEMLHQEALKYKSRIDFIKGGHNAYQAARNRGKVFLDKICSHMRYPTISNPEKTILEEVQKYFPEAKKFRATKLKIPGKEYLKWLEVDICVKSLNRAIEYDSDRYHSFDSLKKGHPTWPEEAVHQYHSIKDSVFRSIGIKILHIKEKEWNEDRRSCLDKCISFLKGDSCQ